MQSFNQVFFDLKKAAQRYDYMQRKNGYKTGTISDFGTKKGFNPTADGIKP